MVNRGISGGSCGTSGLQSGYIWGYTTLCIVTYGGEGLCYSCHIVTLYTAQTTDTNSQADNYIYLVIPVHKQWKSLNY